MNIYLDYLLKNFGGVHLAGAKIAAELIEKYDITDINSAYHKYADDHNDKYHNVERNIRSYISVIETIRDVEKILGCKCFNNKHFTNKEFLAIVKIRAEEKNIK